MGLAGFDYVALGHLHAPQEVAPRVRYSGSLLKYSFAEADHVKAALLVEVGRGEARVEAVPLGQLHDLARLRGRMADLLTRPDLERHRGDLLEITLEDEDYVFDALHRLRQRFPHVLSVVRPELDRRRRGTFSARVAGAGGDDLMLFRAFVEAVAGAPPTRRRWPASPRRSTRWPGRSAPREAGPPPAHRLGPYQGAQAIDFGALGDGDLFLIHGPTGAGKTSIFDGLTYALYGALAGTREVDRLRADRAAPTRPPR